MGKLMYYGLFFCFLTVPFLFTCTNHDNASAATTWEKIVDFGDAGYSETGNAWRMYFNDQSHNGNYRYLSAWEKDLPRVGTATWTTTVPYDGLYRVKISYRRTENRTPDANYSATNSSGGMDEFVVNQRGELKYIWLTLGDYYYKAGQTVRVHLDGTDDNYSDCADAASWTYLGSGSAPMDISHILSPLLNPMRKRLTITKDGPGEGIVTSSRGGIYCGSSCSSDIVVDTNLMLHAEPGRGSLFSGWTGGGCSGKNDCSVSMTTKKEVKATFGVQSAYEGKNKYDLTVTLTGNGSGTVTSSPVSTDGESINCTYGTCVKTYWEDDTVSLTPTAATGSYFVSWTGDGDCEDGSVTMNASKSCTAQFSSGPLIKHTLTVYTIGDITNYGNVTSDPEGINCQGEPGKFIECSAEYNNETTVTLTANTTAGRFTRWEGDCTGTNDVTTVNMNEDKSCYAIFPDFSF